MKSCPLCGEEVQDAAIKCRHCGELIEELPEELPPPVVGSPSKARKASQLRIGLALGIGGLTVIALGFILLRKENPKSDEPKVSDVKPRLERIFQGAKRYFEKGASVDRTGTVRPRMFPAPVLFTPFVECALGKGHRCRGTDWSDPTWKALGFELSGPHKFQYSFSSFGEGVRARFAIRAVARFPGQEKWLVAELTGKVDTQLRVVSTGLGTKVLDSLAILPGADIRWERLSDCWKYDHTCRRDARSRSMTKGGRCVKDKGPDFCDQHTAKYCEEPEFLKAHPFQCRKNTTTSGGGE